MLRRHLSQGLSVVLSLSFLAACDSNQQANDGEEGAGNSETVTVLGVIVGEQQEKLEAALEPFEAETGIDVVYEGTDAFASAGGIGRCARCGHVSPTRLDGRLC
jgi:alpha-glucoside transport system substrate-binding protein